MKYLFRKIPLVQYFLWKIRLKYVRALVWERNLEEELPKTETKIPVNIKTATIHDLRARPHFRRLPLQEDEASKRFSNGDLCFIALWKEIIIGYMWAALRRKVYIPELEREMVLNKREGYLYDGFVFPVFRRKGLFKKMHEEAFHFLKSQDVKSVKGITIITNEAPQRALRDLGSRAVELVEFVKIFRFQKFEKHKLESRTNSFIDDNGDT